MLVLGLQFNLCWLLYLFEDYQVLPGLVQVLVDRYKYVYSTASLERCGNAKIYIILLGQMGFGTYKDLCSELSEIPVVEIQEMLTF